MKRFEGALGVGYIGNENRNFKNTAEDDEFWIFC